jgi:hypothetical protein
MRVRLAQLFDISDVSDLSFVSLFLKRVGSNSSSSFSLSENEVVIDATNFGILAEDSHKILFDDSVAGHTGNGYLRAKAVGAVNDWTVVNYPVSTDNPAKFYLHFRARSAGTSFQYDLLIDGVEVGSFSSVDPAAWSWYTTDFVLPDKEIHQLGIRIKENGALLDKLVISQDATTPTGDGPDFTESQFVTLHLKVHTVVDNVPSEPLEMYAYKTTLDEVEFDEWYNFRMQLLDSPVGDSQYALVLAVSGSNPTNFVIWELVDNDEYLVLPSAIKVDDV